MLSSVTMQDNPTVSRIFPAQQTVLIAPSSDDQICYTALRPFIMN